MRTESIGSFPFVKIDQIVDEGSGVHKQRLKIEVSKARKNVVK